MEEPAHEQALFFWTLRSPVFGVEGFNALDHALVEGPEIPLVPLTRRRSSATDHRPWRIGPSNTYLVGFFKRGKSIRKAGVTRGCSRTEDTVLAKSPAPELNPMNNLPFVIEKERISIIPLPPAIHSTWFYVRKTWGKVREAGKQSLAPKSWRRKWRIREGVGEREAGAYGSWREKGPVGGKGTNGRETNHPRIERVARGSSGTRHQ